MYQINIKTKICEKLNVKTEERARHKLVYHNNTIYINIIKNNKYTKTINQRI